MFKVEQNVPDVFVEESRDFQLFSRLYDLVFQNVKQSCDDVKNINDCKTCPEELLSLLSIKQGIFDNINIPSDAYRKVLSAFPHIMRYKGSLKGITLLTNLFSRICNTEVDHLFLDDALVVSFDTYDNYSDLFAILLEYVRPCGLIVYYDRYIKTDVDAPFGLINSSFTVSDKLSHNDVSVVCQNSSPDNLTSSIGFVTTLKFNEEKTS